MRLGIAEALRKAIHGEMARDENVFCIGEDIGIPGGYGGAFTVTLGLEKDFRERIIDTPISESGIVGVSVGAAMNGLKPVAEMQFIDFLSCGFNQVVNMAAKARYRWNAGVPLVVRGPCGGGVSGGRINDQDQSIEFGPGAAGFDQVGEVDLDIYDIPFEGEEVGAFRWQTQVLPKLLKLLGVGAQAGVDVQLIDNSQQVWLQSPHLRSAQRVGQNQVPE